MRASMSVFGPEPVVLFRSYGSSSRSSESSSSSVDEESRVSLYSDLSAVVAMYHSAAAEKAKRRSARSHGQIRGVRIDSARSSQGYGRDALR